MIASNTPRILRASPLSGFPLGRILRAERNGKPALGAVGMKPGCSG